MTEPKDEMEEKAPCWHDSYMMYDVMSVVNTLFANTRAHAGLSSNTSLARREVLIDG